MQHFFCQVYETAKELNLETPLMDEINRGPWAAAETGLLLSCTRLAAPVIVDGFQEIASGFVLVF
jgi:hypothetical protein